MKVYRLVVALLVLLGASTHTHGVVNGYETPDCSGDFVIADSLETLRHWHGKKFNGKVWRFKSYQTVIDIEDDESVGDCMRFTSSYPIIVPDEPVKDPKPIFLPAFIPRLEGDFDAEKNQKLLDLW